MILDEVFRGVRRFIAELGAPIALAVIALGVLGFVQLADEVSEGETHGFDSAVLLWLRGLPHPLWLQHVVGDLTALGGYAVLTLWVIVAALYLIAVGKKGAALLTIFAVGGGAFLSEALKMGFARPRPDVVEHWAVVQSASFPSGHAMLSAIVYLTLGMLFARLHEKRRIKALSIGVGIALTLIIGLSRIYLGVHWPTDVIGGWALGAAWASLCWLVALRLQRAHLVENESEIA
jgi:undecaprenyl-diphosphatase